MPIQWEFVDKSLIVVVATGNVTFNEFKAYIEEVTLAGGKGLAKLVNLSYANLDLRSADVKALATAVLARAARNDSALGPVALVVDAESSLEFSLLFDDKTSGANRPLTIFGDRQMALSWLIGTRREA